MYGCFNWPNCATYGKIRVDDDLYDLRSVEAEFPAIVIDNTVTPQDALPCKSQVSTPVNDEIDFKISFDESDDDMIKDYKDKKKQKRSKTDKERIDKNNDEETSQRSKPESARHPPETEVTKDKVLPSTQDIQPPVIQKSQDPVKPVSSPISPEPSSAQVDNSPPSKESSKETKLPYPSRVEREKKGENDKMPKYPKDIVKIKLLSKPKEKRIKQRDSLSNPRESKIERNVDFPSCENFSKVLRTFSNPLFEKQDDFPSGNDESILKEEVHKETFKSYLNLLFENDEEIISNEASKQISPKVDVKTIMSFFAPIGNFARKWATSEFVKDNEEINQEVFKSDNKNDLGIHDDKEEEIAFLDGLLEDENFFETNDKKVEFLERKTKEDFETKVEIKSKKELQVFHPDIEILNHMNKPSYFGVIYVLMRIYLVDNDISHGHSWERYLNPG
ncbi:hypothetical protein Tco_1090132 [Tanacetum coccineum]|uniref:Uncharacterized protein n=1 Tax=Tanacetum coccineum TaxID=301880 RepID=A0ABQ5I3C1_9ASTR